MARKVYRFSSFSIDEEDRLLLEGSAVVPLPPKVVETLLLLVSRPGHVISKSELLAALWPDTHVDEGSLKQCVSQLRKAIGDESGDARFIETIPRRGYRWIAPVEVVLEEPGPGEAAVAAAPAAPKRRMPLLVIAVAAVVVAAVASWRAVSPERESVGSTTIPFTAYPGGEYEPQFSPDGRRIAFVWDGGKNNFDIYIRDIDSEELRRITNDEPGEASPCWSPDGSEVAYVRYSETPGVSAVFIASASGGAERRVADLLPSNNHYDRQLAWSPGGGELAVVDREGPEQPHTIYILRLSDGSRRRLTLPAPGIRGDSGPAFSRDGKHVLFCRNISADDNDLYVVPVEGGEPVRITKDAQFIAAHDWSRDGSEVIFSSKRSGDLQLWRVPRSGGTPKRVAAAGTGANFLSVSPKGDLLAYSVWLADTNIWKIPASDSGAGDPVIRTTRREMSPAVSPDGNQVAFRSDQSGSTEIWVADAATGQSRRLTNFGGPLTGSPAWSPDGRSIAFDSRPNGVGEVFVVAAHGGQPRAVTHGPDQKNLPSWSADGRWIYFGSNRTGVWQIWRTSADAPPGTGAAEQVTQGGGFAPKTSPDGKYVYYLRGQNTPGLWRFDLTTKSEQSVLPDYPSDLWGQWAVAADGSVYAILTPTGAAPEIVRWDGRSGKLSTVRSLPQNPIRGDSGFAVAPDMRSFWVAQADQAGSDILLVKGFR